MYDSELKCCPHCGEPGKVYGSNFVGCSDNQCGAGVDFGHWCGTNEDGREAVEFVIDQWNKRVTTPHQ